MVTGTNSSEIIWVDNNISAFGEGGDDRFLAQRSYISNATIYGGSGNDVISDANWRDLTAYGGEGDDSLTGGYAGGVLYGESGNDTLTLSMGTIYADGGSGNDTFIIRTLFSYPTLSVPNWDLYASALIQDSTIIGGDGVDNIQISNSSSIKSESINGIKYLKINYLNESFRLQVDSTVESINGQNIFDIYKFPDLSKTWSLSGQCYFWCTTDNSSKHYALSGASLSNTASGVLNVSNPTTNYGVTSMVSVGYNKLDILIDKPSNSDASVKSAITLSDVLDSLKLYLGKSVTEMAPQKYVAADLDGSGSIDLSDVLNLLKFYLGKTSSVAPSWTFVDAGADLSTLSSKSTTLPSISVDLESTSKINLVGILRGDVNGSWKPDGDYQLFTA